MKFYAKFDIPTACSSIDIRVQKNKLCFYDTVYWYSFLIPNLNNCWKIEIKKKNNFDLTKLNFLEKYVWEYWNQICNICIGSIGSSTPNMLFLAL